MTNKSFHNFYMLALSISLGLILAACNKDSPELPFMSYGDNYSTKPDFAQLEYKLPLSSKQLSKITPEYLSKLPQEKLDQIYARLTAGPIPDGEFDGDLFFSRVDSNELRAVQIAGGGLKGLAVKFKLNKFKKLGNVLWKGKVFNREQRVMRNRIDDLRLLKPLIEADLSNLKKVNTNGKDSWLLFPAKLYCGQSLLDGRRESIIMDYTFSDEIEGYQEKPDFLAGRRGFKVRDEMRMIRPGLYLGRAYMDRAFILNFTLYNKVVDEKYRPQFEVSGNNVEECRNNSKIIASTSNV